MEKDTRGNFHPFKKDCTIVCVVKPLLISKSELEISAPGWDNLCLCQVFPANEKQTMNTNCNAYRALSHTVSQRPQRTIVLGRGS